MFKFGDTVRFSQRGIKKKDLAKESQRGTAYAREHAGEAIVAVQKAISEEPGLTGKEIARKRRGLGYSDIQPSLSRYIKRGHIKRRHLDGYWRYYASNYIFSDEKEAEQLKVKLKTNVIRKKLKADTIKNKKYTLDTWKRVSELLAVRPGLTHAELADHFGKDINVYLYHKMGKLTRESGPEKPNKYRYYLSEVQEPATSKGNPTAVEKALELLAQRPGMSYAQLAKETGKGIDILRTMAQGLVERSIDESDGIYRYYLPNQPGVQAIVVEPETEEQEQPNEEHYYVSPKTLKALEQLAMQYFWETKQETVGLHEFVAWAKTL